MEVWETMEKFTGLNQLKNEKSSYLMAHRDNPVHWWPYEAKAIDRALEEDRPLFLSIGYSSCHWCHVMAHESFEDKETANFLNQHFISIKVDREEYPDVDNYYQRACQLHGGTGGWPLSVFLTPKMHPFFIGTYFPKSTHVPGQITFITLLKELLKVYREDREKAEESARKTIQAMLRTLPKENISSHKIDIPSLMESLAPFEDKENGGYGRFPKFPLFSFHEWAVEQILEGKIPPAHSKHTSMSVEHMLMGGIFDQVRGGIHRYSTDQAWRVPHFEKMLYDQAGLLKLLPKVLLHHCSPLVTHALESTLDYLETEMLSGEGYFFASQDADSEGQEGLFFTFTQEEFENILHKQHLADRTQEISEWFQISKQGSFTGNLNVISLNPKLKDTLLSPANWATVNTVCKALLEERKQRIPPPTDGKGIASWNFLILSGLADVVQYGRVSSLQKRAFDLLLKVAVGTEDIFLQGHPENLEAMRHTTTKETSPLLLEDYAFYCESQLRLYELTGKMRFKNHSIKTARFILNEFIDGVSLLTKAKKSRCLLPSGQRHSFYDSSHRSAASVFMGTLRRVLVFMGDNDLDGVVADVLDSMIHDVLKNPLGAGEALRAVIYPDSAYRLVQVPRNWLNEEQFLQWRTLPFRFVFDFNDSTDNWQICATKQCLSQGKGWDDFLRAFGPHPWKK